MTYIVKRSNGDVVNEGDAVVSFRGEIFVFERVSRGPSYGKCAKVSVRHPGDHARREYYCTVFDLRVTEV